MADTIHTLFFAWLVLGGAYYLLLHLWRTP
jgi:hypothetical protein